MTGAVNERDIPLRSRPIGTGNRTSQSQINDIRTYYPRFPAVSKSMNGADSFALVSSADVTGSLAVGVTSDQLDGGVFAAELPGAVGTSDVATVLTNVDGLPLNVTQVYQAGTNDPLLTDGTIATNADVEVWAIWQSANGVADGTAVAAAAAENLQVTLAYQDPVNDGTWIAYRPPAATDIQFASLALRALRYTAPEGVPYGGGPVPDSIAGGRLTVDKITITATATIAANTVLDFATPANFTIAGTSSVNGTTTAIAAPTMAATLADFNADNTWEVYLNGIQIDKGAATDGRWFTWASATTGSVNRILDPASAGNWDADKIVIKHSYMA